MQRSKSEIFADILSLIKSNGTLSNTKTTGTSMRTMMKNMADSLLYIGEGVPIGGIIMWSGSALNPPPFWSLCDGTNGTPDLRDRFIVGAGTGSTGYVVGQTGDGQHNHLITVANHILTIQEIPSHSHGTPDAWKKKSGELATTYPFDYDDSGAAVPSVLVNSTSNAGGGLGHNHSASSANTVAIPPYYALAYIMFTGVPLNPDIAPPSAPAPVDAITSTSGISVTWGPSVDNFGMQYYRVYVDNVMVMQLPATTFMYFVSMPIVYAQTYTVKVSAVDTSNNETMSADVITSYSTAIPPATLDVQGLNREMESLEVSVYVDPLYESAVEFVLIYISEDPLDESAFYEVYYVYRDEPTIGNTLTQVVTIPDLNWNTTYYFKAKSYGPGGVDESDWSNLVFATTRPFTP